LDFGALPSLFSKASLSAFSFSSFSFAAFSAVKLAFASYLDLYSVQLAELFILVSLKTSVLSLCTETEIPSGSHSVLFWPSLEEV